MKSITLHRAAVDNSGAFVDAGTDLIVGDKPEAGYLDADAARDLVRTHGAVGHSKVEHGDDGSAKSATKAS